MVKSALNTHFPDGARSAADIRGVLREVKGNVRPALTSLSVTDAGLKGPKKVGAIGFKVSGKAGSRSVLIAVVRYSSKGKAVSDSERWELGSRPLRG